VVVLVEVVVDVGEGIDLLLLVVLFWVPGMTVVSTDIWHQSVCCVVKFEQICQMFHIRLVIPDHEDIYLPTDVDLPLYITAVDE